jgi:drug/metabolite transporter (DMT)-like permease
VLLLVSGEAVPSQSSLAWAMAAGASGVIGLGCFYYALSRGTMGVIAPLTAVIGAGVPVFLDLFGGADVPAARLAGIAVALLAVVLISLPPRPPKPGTEQRGVRLDLGELPLVVVSGLGFAGFFIFIDQASVDGAVWWPLAVVRMVGLVGVIGALVVVVSRLHDRGSLRDRSAHALGVARLRSMPLSGVAFVVVIAVAGIGDLGGNAFFVLGTQAGDFAVTVILASLYPVVTTVLAAIFLHERLRPVQILGVVLATLSVVLLR